MKKFKSVFSIFFALSAGILLLASCDRNNDPIPAVITAKVDVVIKSIKVDEVQKYAVYVNASSNYDIKTAKVTAPGTGGKVYHLTATSDKKQFVFSPQSTDYVVDVPVKGDYSFEIVSTESETITGKDAVGDEKLGAITIKSATMTNTTLTTTWDKVADSDAYVVKLYSADHSELMFASGALASETTQFELKSSTSGWANGKSPVVNTNYVVELSGVRFETGVTAKKEENIQFITLDSKTIKWE